MYRYERDKYQKEQFAKYFRELDMSRIHNAKVCDKRYINMMTSMSHTYGNVLAWVQKYVLDLMPEDTFKTIHVNSKIAHRQLRSTNHEFLKKTKPMIIFRPRIAGMDEDRFLKGTPLIERQYDLYNTYGGTNLQAFFNDPKNDISIKFQQNRSVLNVDVIMIFSTLMNQIDYVHYLQNALAWNSPKLIPVFLESYIPQEMLKIVSDISHIPLYDEQNSTKTFLQYMEQNSNSPITYKLQGSTGSREFYRYYNTNLDVNMTDLSWDDGEKVGHIMNQYQITFSLRVEFYSTGFYYIFSDKIFDINLPRLEMDNSKVIPVFTDVISLEDLNLKPGWHIYNKASCMLEDINDKICIDELMNNSIRNSVKYCMDNGIPFKEFLDIKIRRQGKLIQEGIDYKIDYSTFTIYFNNQSSYFTYRILVCLNVEYINDLIKSVYNLK